MIPYAKIFDFGKKAVSTYKAGQQQFKPGPAPAGLKPVNAPARAVVKKPAPKPAAKAPAPPAASDNYNLMGFEIKKSTGNVLGSILILSAAAAITYRVTR